MFRVSSFVVILLATVALAHQSVLRGGTAVGVLNYAADPQLLTEFHSWASQHEKVYETHDEALERLLIWKQNNDMIEHHNNQLPKPKFTLGHNEFSDLTQDEFHERFSLGKYSPKAIPKPSFPLTSDSASTEMARRLMSEKKLQLPDNVNWIALGGVTPVKNQGACGACWAFSTTGALEGARYVKTGELVALSEQNLLDCDHTDLGCRGGLMDNAFKFDEKSGGLCSEEDYPYEAKQNKMCNTNCTDVPGSIVKSFVDVPPGDEMALLAAIALQPISIAVQANQFVFQFYKHGVLDDDTCGKEGNIDHGVLAVGYASDLETNTPYWLVKNSWGNTWGDNGYLKIARNSTNPMGMCAILKMASFPVLE